MPGLGRNRPDAGAAENSGSALVSTAIVAQRRGEIGCVRPDGYIGIL